MKYHCKECGGSNVQHAMWVCLNTNKTQDGFGSWCNGDNSWCADCGDHTEIEEVKSWHAHSKRVTKPAGVKS